MFRVRIVFVCWCCFFFGGVLHRFLLYVLAVRSRNCLEKSSWCQVCCFWVHFLFLRFFADVIFVSVCFLRDKAQVVTRHPQYAPVFVVPVLLFCPAAAGLSTVLDVRPASWRFLRGAFLVGCLEGFGGRTLSLFWRAFGAEPFCMGALFCCFWGENAAGFWGSGAAVPGSGLSSLLFPPSSSSFLLLGSAQVSVLLLFALACRTSTPWEGRSALCMHGLFSFCLLLSAWASSPPLSLASLSLSLSLSPSFFSFLHARVRH